MAGGSTEVDIFEEEEERHFKQIYKVLIIGDSNVGKTALLTRFVEGHFQSVFMSTVGIDYKTKGITLEDENIKLQIWDTAGQERFRTLTNAYFRGAAGAVLLYDITSRTTFNNILSWMDSIREHGSPNIKIALVGHKTDLEDERQVSTEEGRKLAENYDCLFFEASSKAGKNCGKIFTLLAQEIKHTKDESCYVRQSNSTPLMDDSRLALPETSLHTAGRKSGCCP